MGYSEMYVTKKQQLLQHKMKNQNQLGKETEKMNTNNFNTNLADENNEATKATCMDKNNK